MKKHQILIIALCLATLLTTRLTFAQIILSPDARISLLTASPGGELYSVFGHSALLVIDPAPNIDEVYNWGTFDFDTPNFYLKFMRGQLLYMLTVVPLQDFLLDYHFEGRAVYEQQLELSQEEKQLVYDYLQINRRPENVYYQYDFIYDNCATRIRDLIDVQMDIHWGPDPHPHDERSFRDILHPYLEHMPWTAFGIDILLGIPADKKATPWHYMFLPDEMFIAFQHARHQNGRLLVHSTNELLAEQLLKAQPFPVMPAWVMWGLLIMGSVLFLTRRKLFKAFCRIYFVVIGLLGLMIFFMWFLSDHVATAMNLNILWALPTHIYFAFRMWPAQPSRLGNIYFRLALLMNALLLLLWPLNPQSFHPAFFPVIALAAVVAYANVRVE